ncbi:ribbon-helix-helix domain-containing protein [Promethearchaeum syntrophicum]|uniref:Ribbon-helix-helix domain-containing protein n=1 Tax=Promethearchaeum syntrophicum TaxID=2594042 RepID=A0A5B9DCX6_9ARCH|nr:ribbon-helix-helix domain-containing protein [Candidatus Prometheoarchaeum syntrophicum]QEE16845.1 hypothetical protein DSAG12_02675 [Candidatus Prometheoarchaeum syntrophicum]
MASKTTVAVDQKLRKKIKKLSALLDIPQSAVIEKAIANLEEKMIKNKYPKKKMTISDNIDISEILEETTKKIWKRFPEREKNQKLLENGSQTIDNFLLSEWITGLEE